LEPQFFRPEIYIASQNAGKEVNLFEEGGTPLINNFPPREIELKKRV